MFPGLQSWLYVYSDRGEFLAPHILALVPEHIHAPALQINKSAQNPHNF